MNKVTRRITTDIALRVSILYALFGGLWILLSDRLLELLITDISQLSKIQTYKGWMYVALSALLIYSLLSRELHFRSLAEKKILQLKRLYATLSQVNQMIVRVKDRDELFQTICDVAVQFGEISVAWVGLLDEVSGDVKHVAAHGLDLNHWPFPIVNIQGGLISNGLIARAIRTSNVTTSADLQADQSLKPLHDKLREFGFHSSAVIPFRLKGTIIGALTLISEEIGLFHDTEGIGLLDEMGISISFALDTMAREEERRQAEAETISLAKFPAENPNPILRISSEGVILYANRNSQPLLDLWMCAVGSTLPDPIREIVSACLEKNSSREIDIDCNGRIFSVIFAPIMDAGYVNGYGRDITERIRAEKKVVQMKRLYATLSQVNQMIIRVKERDELFQTICDVAVQFGEIPLAWIGLIDEESGDVQPIVSKGLDIAQLPLPHNNIHREEFRDSPIATAFRTSKVTTSDDILTDSRTSTFTTGIQAFPYRAAAIIPFRLRDKTIGVLTLLSSEKGVFRDEDEIRLLDEMGLDISFALDNMQNEMERKAAEEALQLSEERFRLLFENNHSVMMMLDPASGSIRAANAAAAKFYGYSLSELQSMKIDQINQLSPEEVHAERTRALKEEGNYFNFQHRLRNGEIRAVEVYSAPIELDGSTVLFSIIHDITERKIAEDQLRQSEERYRLISENTADVIWMLDPMAGRFTYVSPSVEKLRGYTPAEVMSQHVSEALTPESFQFVSNELATNLPEFLAKGEGTLSFISEVDQPCKDGSIVHTEATTTFMFNSQGQVEVIGVSRNINERKHAEEKLRRNEHVLRLFVEHSPACIAMLDRDMHYIIASKRYLVDYRLGEQDLTGRSHYEVFPEIPERWKEIHRRCLEGAIEKADEDPFPREDGTLDWVRWEIHPWYEETGHIGGIILFTEVITDRKKVKDELHLLNLQLEQRVAERTLELSQANRAKDEFLANMSHELRTPLNTVLGLSETLLEQRRGPLNEKQVHSIDLIASSGRHLLSLINDILEVSKIEAGKLDLHPGPVSVKELCESSLNFIKEMAIKKLINVQFHNDESVSTIIADAQRVKQILINLLTNAVKFTPERGRVSLQVYTSAERDRILFSITDTGIGIVQEDLKKLFTPFTQLDSSLARQYAGTGLGLALVQKLTDLHGGSVQVESESGQGSRFTIILPLNPYIREQPPSESVMESGTVERVSMISDAMPKQQGTILLAEDNEINSRMLAEYLMAQGYTVFTAQNGEEVLEKAAQNPPGIILMDIQMPQMDGLEATRRLREDPRFASTPIIALTALAMPGDRERCLEAGANEYMSKPASLKKLVESMQKLMETET